MGIQPRQADIKFTYQDYLLMPEDKRCELIEGDFFMTPSPLSGHQKILSRLFIRLGTFIEGRNLGELLSAPMDVYLSEQNVLQPDLLFVSKDRESIIQRECVRGAPDLVIEILSPSTAQRDREIKKHLYARYGVLEYWIVNPALKTVEVMQWTEKGFKTLQVYPQSSTLSSEVLKDFNLSLEQVFTF